MIVEKVTIQSSDNTVKYDKKYNKKVAIDVGFTGKLTQICDYSLTIDGKTILKFKNLSEMEMVISEKELERLHYIK